VFYEVNYGRQIPCELQLKNLRLIDEDGVAGRPRTIARS
jgi:hypothetical protein